MTFTFMYTLAFKEIIFFMTVGMKVLFKVCGTIFSRNKTLAECCSDRGRNNIGEGMQEL